MPNEQKIEHLRHSLAHLLAAAVLELYPDAKPTIGPAIENGFYYDFDFANVKISDEDLEKIEDKMKELLPSWETFARIEVSADEARRIFKNNEYKLELIDEIEKEGQEITLYYSGSKDSTPEASKLESYKLKAGFLDLCRGGHVNNPNQDINPDGFTLDRLAGAYWRGDENNPMLTRIYGLAFETKDELAQYLEQREEAFRRDHKRLGKELDLFTFSDLVGPGLPLWTPKGTLMRNLLDEYVWSLRQSRGYEKVEIPHITKRELYETSGHWDKFKEDLFRIKTREDHEFALKPMNCPHHTQIFNRKKWSYREMPQKYANTTMCYRDEQTGELSGIMRVRAFTQDDAHVFCREDQVKEEAFKIWDIIESFYKTFNFKLKVRLSIHDPENMERYLGDESVWEKAVDTFRKWLKERNVDYFEAVGEAAFYGPKIDFIAVDSLGREWQVATIQIDRNMPERFGLTYVNDDGKEERVVMIHAAIMGSIERFMGTLIEHLGGIFPVWLSPVQAIILPISDKHLEYAQKTAEQLRENSIRVEVDERSESVGKKIREATMQKVPYMLVVGDKEVEKNAVAVRTRGGEDLGALIIDEFLEKLSKEVNTKS